MEKYIEYVNRVHEWNVNEVDFINNQLKKHLDSNQENQTEIEHILDFLYSTKKSYKNIGYKTILEKTNAWNKKLIESASSKDSEVEWVDYEVVKDFWDGFRFVKLISEIAYQREWKLMSHCVASYYGRNVNIYSLRDSKNLPHCTIEENNQVKGKWNQTVDNKYFAYCIKFLEEMGMSIWENEMKNIWFYKLESIDKSLSIDEKYLFDWKYVSEKHLDKIKDKEWDIYYWFWLFNIKKLVEINIDFSLKWNFDFNFLLKYVNKKANDNYSTAVANDNYSTAVANGHSSTAVANRDSSIAVANESYSTAVANDSYSTAVANDNYSTAVANGHSSIAVANKRYSIAVANDNYSTAVANDSYSTAVANDNYSTAVANGEKNSIALCIGYNSKAKGKIWVWLILSEYDQNDDLIIDIQSKKIDWEIIKEDTFYTLKDWEFKIVE